MGGAYAALMSQSDGAGAADGDFNPPPLKRTHSIHVIPEGDDAKTEPETETDTDTKPAAWAAAPAPAPAPAPQFRGSIFFVAPALASSSMSVHGRGLGRLHTQNKRRLNSLLDQSWVDLSQNDKETAMKHSEIMMNDLMDAGIDSLASLELRSQLQDLTMVLRTE